MIWSRFAGVLLKEFIQIKRDRVTLATMVTIPLVQILLFGYAINTQPRDLPTAVLMQEASDLGRSILAAAENTGYLRVTRVVETDAAFDQVVRSGEVLFAIEIPVGFERAVRRGESPALLVSADASDPVASSAATSAIAGIVETALADDRIETDASPPPFRILQHNRFNPAGSSSLNIVPGLLGLILTMTLLIFTALSVTREAERGTMENLLAMPIRPVEIMLGKVVPYVIVGFVQAILIVSIAVFVFDVPIVGSLAVLALLTTLFIATNLSIGYTFSTVAGNQLQAMQMVMMFILPNILLSGFMFPFAGMPAWARAIGEALPLTHFLRIVRGVTLKGADLYDLRVEALALAAIMAIAMAVAVKRFRQTLD